MSWLTLLPRASASKDIELLVLRHKIAVLRRTNPRLRLDWADRTNFTSLTRRLPAMLHGHRLITPATILRWHQRRFVETFSLLAMILARTTRVTVFPDVANLPLRPPAVLAKAAASLDVLSGGRFELGLGAGGFFDAIEAYGGPRRTPGEALRALEEAITVIRPVWSGERNLRVDGQFSRLAGAHSGPVPAHPIGLWLGAYGPRALRGHYELGQDAEPGRRLAAVFSELTLAI